MKRRDFIALGLMATTGLVACRSHFSLRRKDARIDARVRGRTDSASSASDAMEFPTLAAAIAAAPDHGAQPFRIQVGAGRWHEKLIIDKPNIHLVGEGRARSIISFDAAAGMRRPDGEPWGTWGCASVIVRAPDFRAEQLTIENTFDYVGNLSAPKFEPIGPNGAQAVALMLDAAADRCLLQDVDIHGHQDTLFVDAGRSLFRRCRISGSVDFVFGSGQSWLEDCEIVSRFRPGKERQGYIAVPSTLQSRAHGLVFSNCRLLREPGIPDGSVALGRAWRPGRTFADGKYGDPAVLGSAVFLSCWMDAHIAREGWDPMAYTARDGSRGMLQPLDARLFEFDSRGPGAAHSAGRRWLDAASAAQITRQKVLGGWTSGS